jgi:hypothetical protein
MPIRELRRMTLKRARDFAVCIAVGIIFGLAVAWYGFSSKGSGAELIGRWVGLTGTTLILFGYAIRSHGRFISRLSFWLVMLALLVVHLSVFIVILGKVEHWKVLWFVLAYPVDSGTVGTVGTVGGQWGRGQWDSGDSGDSGGTVGTV